jgi:hypothetical protein
MWFFMPAMIKFLADPGTWLIIITIVENFFIVLLYRHWGAGVGFSIWRLLCCILLSVILFVITFAAFVLFSNNSYRKSIVDASPIAELSSDQIDRLEDVIERFKEYDFITRFDIEEEEYTGPHLSKIYSFVWRREKPHSLLGISVNIYRDEQRAIDDIQFWARLSDEEKQPYTLIENDNNTEALLYDSRMIRSADALYFPNSQRHINSGIRLGNAHISMSETQEYYNLDKDVSSEFIKLLCEMLKDMD